MFSHNFRGVLAELLVQNIFFDCSLVVRICPLAILSKKVLFVLFVTTTGSLAGLLFAAGDGEWFLLFVVQRQLSSSF